MKTYTGYTSDTADNLLLDAGAFFVNFEVGTDTYESAREAGKLLGATRGGGEFKAGMSVRAIEVDGVRVEQKVLSATTVGRYISRQLFSSSTQQLSSTL